MGSALGWALREAGNDVVTSLEGRSARSVRLASEAGLRVVPGLSGVVAAAEVILVVTPPDAALDAARGIAAAASGNHAVVVDLNAIAPSTSRQVGEIVMAAGLDYVDGSISGPPPTVRPGANIYLSGSRANEIATLQWKHVNPIVVGPTIGAASAVKMSTASVYKGTIGLLAQAIRAADAHGVLDIVLADLGTDLASPFSVALAATKAERYVPEMHQIAMSQKSVGLTPALFEALAAVWSDVARTSLAGGDPESVDREITGREVADRLRQEREP
jgi:3-hydroxyisobutyrate dehydrogenase-like beta-hydroxyacid dehydrogenase